MERFKKIVFAVAYWLVSLTWGALGTIPGLLITLFCIVFLNGKPHRNGCSYIVEVGGNWGGLCLGCVALCGRYSQEDGPCHNPYWFEHTRRHEFGHGLQQLVFGPFQLFLVMIPSAVRYWYDRLHGLKHPYDYAWFEYTASKFGYKYLNWIEGKNMEYTYKREK